MSLNSTLKGLLGPALRVIKKGGKVRSQYVCKGARSIVEGERCVVSSCTLFKRLEVNEAEEEEEEEEEEHGAGKTDFYFPSLPGGMRSLAEAQHACILLAFFCTTQY